MMPSHKEYFASQIQSKLIDFKAPLTCNYNLLNILIEFSIQEK
jgi:hypothetical protein